LQLRIRFSWTAALPDVKMIFGIEAGPTMINAQPASAFPLFNVSNMSADAGLCVPTSVGYVAYLLAANEPVFELPRLTARMLLPRIAPPCQDDPAASLICFV
jgi:hypothetical protein